MSCAAVSVAEASTVRVEPVRRGARGPRGWLWIASIAVQSAIAWALTSYTWFFVDDFYFMEQARDSTLSAGYLRRPLFEHFSPVSRLLDKILVALAPGSFALAHAIEILMYASALVALALVICTVLGNGWTAFALSVLFGQSIFLMRLLNWWTATANILPATIFVLLALLGYLRWRRNRSRAWLALSVAAYALALLDYETAMLWPAYLAVIALLILEPRLSPRAWLASLWRDRTAWAWYVALDIAALVNFRAFYYRPPLHGGASAGQLLHYLAVALLQTFVPAMLGVQYPEGSMRLHLPVVLVSMGLLLALTTLVMWIRPRSWRCVLGFAVLAVLTMLPVGLERIGHFGVRIGRELYYQQSLQMLFLVLAAFALSVQYSGRRVLPSRILSRVPRALVSRGALAGMLVLCAAAYAVLYLNSVRVTADASRRPRRAAAYVRHYLASARAVARRTGHWPSIIDQDVPGSVLSKHLFPYSTTGQLLALFDHRIRVERIAQPTYAVAPDGRLYSLRFSELSRSKVRSAKVALPHGGGWKATAHACVPQRAGSSWLHVPFTTDRGTAASKASVAGAARPDSATAATGTGSAATPAAPLSALRLRLRLPRSATVILVPLRAGAPAHTKITRKWTAGRHGALIGLGEERGLDTLAIRLPSGGCVTEAAFGVLRAEAA